MTAWFRIFSLICSLLVATDASVAITIDTWDDDGFVSSGATTGSTGSAHFPGANVLGGGRKLVATKTTAGIGLSRVEMVDHSLGYTQGAHRGYGSVSWDGDTNPSVVKSDGLGGVDFTQDDADAFVLDFLFFDYPFNQPIDLAIRVYDAGASDGLKYSEVLISLNRFWAGPGGFDLTIPFALFAGAGVSTIDAPEGGTFATETVVGSKGATDLKNVGAITVSFLGLGNAKAPDLMIGHFITNGRCSSVPNAAGKVVDSCSVCLNKSEPVTAKDRCGVCLSGPSGYSYSSNQIFDDCGQCPGEKNYHFPSGSKDECGICLSGPGSYVYQDIRDVCGVCGGTATLSSQCPGIASDCQRVKPTGEILGFEKKLMTQASALKKRFLDDVARAARNHCPISYTANVKAVGDAFSAIAGRSRATFRKGVQVCGTSCVTVSYAKQVRALRPQFSVLERESTLMANKVKKCYEERKITRVPGSGGRGVTGIIQGSRQALDQLVSECRRTNVCK